MKKWLGLLGMALMTSWNASAQYTLKGTVRDSDGAIPAATLILGGNGGFSDESGAFSLAAASLPDTLEVRAPGYLPEKIVLQPADTARSLTIRLRADKAMLEEVVVTGTMKEISRMDSPIPVEVVTPKLFQKNPAPNLFESIGMLNGVKPQLNCNVCNTGDIHINGMEGPYTMVLIDGMPIVSALSSVYGLSGIPNSLVERIEVVKGPAASLYGSEAMGGIINVITRNPLTAPRLSVDIFGTSWQEYSADLGLRFRAGKLSSLLGFNYFNYSQPADHNRDGFTDVTLQHRISVFNKWSLPSRHAGDAGIAFRYVYEDRWGGQMNWNRDFRGSDSIYGESIYTSRFEMIGKYHLPLKEKITAQFSYNYHKQNSYYGTTPYMADQQVAFVQLYWNRVLLRNHDLLAGAALRYTYYDDNTPATTSPDGSSNAPAATPLPGLFVQDEWRFHKKHMILAGYRFDYDQHHGGIHSPRFAYKWSPDANNTLRASFGTGFRVVNLFTEDHAALTGSRQVVIAEELQPERSYNANLNYVVKTATQFGFVNLDLTAFYAHFTNRIVADYDTDPNQIIYDNLDGYALSRGTSVNTELGFTFPLRITAGVTYMDVFQHESVNGLEIRQRQMFAPEWSGNFIASYAFGRGWSTDVTANWYGPMRLPVLPHDFRPEYSPFYTILNLQLTKKIHKDLELYGGVKNLLNFVPANPIMRPQDPFDKQINDPVNNPHGYTFDPSYNYAPLQGIRGFIGLRWQVRKG